MSAAHSPHEIIIVLSHCLMASHIGGFSVPHLCILSKAPFTSLLSPAQSLILNRDSVIEALGLSGYLPLTKQ